ARFGARSPDPGRSAGLRRQRHAGGRHDGRAGQAEGCAMSMREFDRGIDALNAMFVYTREAFAKDKLDARLLPVVDLALEELFTNVVKYATESRSRVRIDIGKVPNGVEVTVTDHDVDFFDVTRTGDVDVNLPIEQR